MSENLLDKLYNMGIIGTKRTLSQANKVTVSAFCRQVLYNICKIL